MTVTRLPTLTLQQDGCDEQTAAQHELPVNLKCSRVRRKLKEKRTYDGSNGRASRDDGSVNFVEEGVVVGEEAVADAEVLSTDLCH